MELTSLFVSNDGSIYRIAILVAIIFYVHGLSQLHTVARIAMAHEVLLALHMFEFQKLPHHFYLLHHNVYTALLNFRFNHANASISMIESFRLHNTDCHKLYCTQAVVLQ